MNDISKKGYKDNSPYKNRKKLKIDSDSITMKGVSQPILGISDKGQSQLMLPEQEYYFPNANYIMEYKLQKGGYLDLLQNYLPTIPENEQDELIDTLDALSEQDRYDHLEQMMNGGCLKCDGKMEKGGNWIQNAVNKKHEGFCTPMTKSTCTPRRKAFAMTMKKHHGFHEQGGQVPELDFNNIQEGIFYVPDDKKSFLNYLSNGGYAYSEL